MKDPNTPPFPPVPEQETSRPPSVARSLHSVHEDDEDNSEELINYSIFVV